ncbi:MAG: endo-beta-1,4-glucanase [Monoraphidium minutum]|nr:MAG: endo-beta-1,4-glucanase [Monoraphidium minutum]
MGGLRCAPLTRALVAVALCGLVSSSIAAESVGGAALSEGPGRSLLAAAATKAAARASGNGFDYGQVLGLSYLFYEAQRSGKLPGDQRVKWRGDSALQDKGPEGQDLTGGYYDAADYVKFHMPLAFTVSMLAITLIEFPKGVADAGQTGHAYQALRWGSDYLLKSVLGNDRIVGQVGEGKADHNFWRRAEDVKETRKASVCDPSKPGSDVAGAMAGALAATAVAFKGRDAGYAAQCTAKAKTLYNFANKYRGFYHEKCAPDAANFYASKSYNDDLAWAALWLKRATGDWKYVEEAKKHYEAHKQKDNFNAWPSRKYGFFWDTYSPGVALMLMQETGGQEYRDHWNGFKEVWTSMKGNEHVNFSPKGYAWYIKDLGWGNLRHNGNAQLLALWGAKGEGGGERERLTCWAHGQMHYMLGEGGRSYVVGYGSNPPVRPHHRGASCPNAPAGCDYRMFTLPGPNPRTITGALVGGPDPSDIYKDERTDARNNEVAIDYNSGFTGALAGLKQAGVDYDWCKSKGMRREKKGRR